MLEFCYVLLSSGVQDEGLTFDVGNLAVFDPQPIDASQFRLGSFVTQSNAIAGIHQQVTHLLVFSFFVTN